MMERATAPRARPWMAAPVCAAALVLSFPPLVCGAPRDLGRAGEAHVLYEAAQGLGGIEIQVSGVRFHPLTGAAALGADGKPDPSLPLSVTPRLEGNALRLEITEPQPPPHPPHDGAVDRNSTPSKVWNSPLAGVDPGVVRGLGEWRRLDLSRYSEPYGQTWWQKTTYSVEGDFWFTAHWVMEEGDGTRWKATNQANRGTDPFPAALQVLYEPDTAGNYLPIHEVLELRFSRNLWDVVPVPRQQPSEYRDFLRRSVFVDMWGGHPASELKHFLGVLKAIARDEIPFYTIKQNWECAGWDALLPDSMWLPDYPPNPAVGTIDELRELCELGKSMGRFGFRTNYRLLRPYSPSFQRGMAHFAVDAEGKPLDYLRCADWLAVAGRADREIEETFAPTACFTDQMTSGAAPWSWHDWAADSGSRSMRQTLDHQKALARQMKSILGGPLGSESLADQHLLGEFVDTGDFDVKNGHSRLFSPEFKLRRLQHLSGFHGMGLMYRFYEMPPFKAFLSSTTTFGNDDAQLDDYRCCEILYGNGGYVCHDFANWRYYLTEVLLVGHLQRHYSGVPVRNVQYWHAGKWTTLAGLVRSGVVPNIVPWNPQTQAFGRIRIEYKNGLTVVVNRLDDDFAVPIKAEGEVVLPKSGWVAWKEDKSVLAFSAYQPGTTHRVDYLRDGQQDVEYLDPRSRTIRGVSTITLWSGGEVVLSADASANTVTVEGKTLQLGLPAPPPRPSLDFAFERDLDGWRTTRGILTAESQDGVLRLKLAAPGAYMHSPSLNVPADEISAIELRMRIEAESAKPGGLYFTTDEHPNIWNDKLINFEVKPDGEWHTYRLDVAAHPRWKGTITGLRLDPVRGVTEATVEIDWLRGTR